MVMQARSDTPTACPHGCIGGYVLDVVKDSVTMCRCEIRRIVARAMHEDVRAARPTVEHANWVQTHAKDLDRAVLTGAKADVLAVARCMHNALRVDHPGRFVVLTDRELVKMVTASWHAKDAEAESADEKIVRPDVLVLWLGSLRDGPRASSEIILDALKVRRESRHITWLAHDPVRRCWLHEQEAWIEVQDHLSVHYAQLEVPRVLGKPTPVKTTLVKEVAPMTPTSSPAPTTTRALVAKVKGTCVVCQAPIEKGDEFAWANAEKGRAHPACMPST